MGKIYCTECGSELEDTAIFCSSCGTPVDKRDRTTNPNEVSSSNISSNDNSVEIKEESNKSNKSKYFKVGIVIGIILLIVISFFVIVTVTSPLFTADYTVDTTGYYVSSDKVSTPTFDNEFTGSNVNFRNRNGNGEIDIWHHSANGHDVDYFLKQYATYDKDTSGTSLGSYYGAAYDYGVKIKHTNDITIDNVKGYIMDGTWGLGFEYTWVILVHNDEYYLICFDNLDQDLQDKFLESFKFK